MLTQLYILYIISPCDTTLQWVNCLTFSAVTTSATHNQVHTSPSNISQWRKHSHQHVYLTMHWSRLTLPRICEVAHWLKWWTRSAGTWSLCMCYVAKSNPARCIILVTLIPMAIITHKVRGWNSSNWIPHCTYIKRFVIVNSEPIRAWRINKKNYFSLCRLPYRL